MQVVCQDTVRFGMVSEVLTYPRLHAELCLTYATDHNAPFLSLSAHHYRSGLYRTGVRHVHGRYDCEKRTHYTHHEMALHSLQRAPSHNATAVVEQDFVGQVLVTLPRTYTTHCGEHGHAHQLRVGGRAGLHLVHWEPPTQHQVSDAP